MIISLSGAQGSGKSTIAQMLAVKLNWPRYYVGGFRREAAKARGLTLAQYNALGEEDFSTDREFDEFQKKLGETKDNFIIEGRTSWYFIPHSVKIYLDVNPDEGAKRIFSHLQQKNDRNEDENLDSWQAVKASNERRLASDNLRYQKYYGFNVHEHKHYDFCLDTSSLSIDEVFDVVWKFIEKKRAELIKVA